MINIARNAFRRGYGGEMLRKVWIRWADRGRSQRAQARSWCKKHQVDAADWARSVDARLWKEVEAFSRDQQARALKTSQDMGLPVGGAGYYELLYFLTRLIQPATIVETGVAFGFSSRAFLRALTDNGKPTGRLYSSDFPYFRMTNPEKLIGCLVEEELHDRWVLLTNGDRKNLPRIARDVTAVDLLHYDSDKSYSGRSFALRTLGPRLTEEAVILFDDIQGNLHFRDLVEQDGKAHRVFEFGGKWIGLTGGPDRLYRNGETTGRA